VFAIIITRDINVYKESHYCILLRAKEVNPAGVFSCKLKIT